MAKGLWVYGRGPCGNWHWHYPELPNGWSPNIADDSQACAPAQATSYRVSACSRNQIIQSISYSTLEQAKREAILFAMEQRNAEEVWNEAMEAVRP